jgi:glycerophosphoryl diester phosphodiesterase
VSLWQSAGALVIGHRGGRGEGWPRENTLAAFEQAWAQGARAIELDVRTCGTGEVIVRHDPTRAPLQDLRREEVPTLAEVLAWAWDRDVALNVEMKHDVPSRVALIEPMRRALRRSRGDVLLSSFDPFLLVATAVVLPSVRRALLTSRAQRRHVPSAFIATPYIHALHLERTQTQPAVLAAFRRRGLRLGVWTVNDPREAGDLVALGVQSVITDDPGALLAVDYSGQVTASTRIPGGAG